MVLSPEVNAQKPAPELLEGVYDLLISLFDEGHLRRWVAFIDQAIAAQLPGTGASLSVLAFGTVDLIRRYGVWDAVFDKLEDDFPRRRSEIRRVRSALADAGNLPTPGTATVNNLLARLTDAGFFDELARAVGAERAKAYLQSIGIDAKRFPQRYSDSPSAWWSQAIAVFMYGSAQEQLNACRILVTRALEDFPGNPVFRSVRNMTS